MAIEYIPNPNGGPPIKKATHIVDLEIIQYKNNIEYFDSLAELNAGLNYDKKRKYFEPKKMPKIFGLQMSFAQQTYLEGFKDRAVMKSWFSKMMFATWVEINGVRRFFQYKPSSMVLAYGVLDDAAFAKISKQKALQAECDKLTIKAGQVFTKLKAMSSKPMTAAEYKQFVNSVAAYNVTVSAINKMEGVKVQMQEFKPAKVSGSAIGLEPFTIALIILAITAIIATATVVALNNHEKNLRLAKQYQGNLDAQAKNLDAISQADLDYKAGKITLEARNKIWQIAQENNDAAKENNEKITTEDTSSTIDKLTNLAAVAAAGFIIFKMIK